MSQARSWVLNGPPTHAKRHEEGRAVNDECLLIVSIERQQKPPVVRMSRLVEGAQ